VRLIEIDVIGLQPREAGLDLVAYPRCRESRPVRPVAHGKPHLGGDNEVVAPAGPSEPATDHLLGRTRLVDVGGIDEVAAALEVAVEDHMGLVLVGLLAEGHGSQAELGHERAG
jgi:hypothetical protein